MTNTSSILKDILSRLARVRRLQLVTDVQSSALVFASALLLILTLVSLLEIVGQFSSSVRTVLAMFFGAVIIALLMWYVIRPVLRYVGILQSWDDFTVAKKVGARFTNVLDRILNLLQLHREMQSGKSLYSPELVDASFQDLNENVRDLDFATSVDRSPVRRAARWFVLTVVGAALLAAGLSSSLYGAADRLVHFATEYTRPAKYTFEVSPGDQEVVKGSDVEVLVKVTAQSSSEIPSNDLRLATRLEGQTKFDDVAMHSDADKPGVFRTTLAGMRGSTEYFVQLDDVQSEMYRLTVLDRPVLRSLQVKLDYPFYTKLPSKIQDEFVGDVTALAGTRVSLSGEASKTLERGRLILQDGKPVPLNVRREQFNASFVLKSDDEYSIEVQDTERLINQDPVKYSLKVIPDEVPTVTITQPGRNIDLAGSEALPLIVVIKDDFGFSKLQLGYRLVHSRYVQPSENPAFVQIPLPATQGMQVEVPYRWDLAPLSLVPEDVVEYFVEIFDNDVVNGPKSARSQTYLLRLPSLEEVFTDADKEHEQSLDDLKQAMEEAKKLKESLETINQDLKTNKEFDWQEQKKLEEMAKKYQEMQKKLDEVKSRVDEMVQKMEEQNVLSQETLEKYLELQEIFEQLNSEELQQMMKQMQQAMQNMDRNKLQQTLEQMTFSEERFRQSIERTMNLLKRIQVEQKMDEATTRAEDIKQQQGEVQQQTAESQGDQKKTQELAKQQEDLAAKQEKLEELMKELQRRMEEFFTEMPADKLAELNKQLQQQQLQQTMKSAAQNMRQGQQQQAQQQQQMAGQQLDEMLQQLEQMQSEMLQNQAQYVMNEMRRAIKNLLELSKRQEELKDQARNAPPNSPQLRQNAQDQLRVQKDLGNVINGLGELSQRSFAVTPEMSKSIGEALARMQGAMRALESRNGTQASQDQARAMASLNEAATQVQSMLQQMMQGGGTGMGSLMQQLQMMAGQQMGLNMQTQRLGEGELSQEQAAQAARLAQEQDAIRKSLEQLNKEAEASGDRERLMGDLNRVAEEMREVVRNLEQQNVNPETIQKQDRILSRLLDASKSMRERDFEKKRKAQTGTQITRQSPGELDPSDLEGGIRQDLLKALEQGYSKDYQELIRLYFEQLQKLRGN